VKYFIAHLHCQDIEVVAGDLAKCLEQATSSVLMRVEELQSVLERQETDVWQFQAGARNADVSVKQHAEKIKNGIDFQVGDNSMGKLSGMAKPTQPSIPPASVKEK